MGYIHILRDRTTKRPWWPADERLDIGPDEKVFTECCACNVRASEAVARLHLFDLPLGGPGDYQEQLEDWESPGFDLPYEPGNRWEIRCAPDAGCNRFPRKRCGAYLRQLMHDGY